MLIIKTFKEHESWVKGDMLLNRKNRLKTYWELPGNDVDRLYLNDVLNRKRDLTLPQIVKLHKKLNIPDESIIEEQHYF